MDEPGWSWPAWKFDMKRDALFTTLHDQYNTFSSTIQDPDAFHHDVFEIANDATTPAEFHHRLAERRDQRLRELNESLESASFEIIANPALVGTPQWEHALQLFRTRSLDSLVRYFASYLPDDHPWRRAGDLAASSQATATATAELTATGAADAKHLFPEAALTHEPLSMSSMSSSSSPSSSYPHHELPPSPRSFDDSSPPSSVCLFPSSLRALTPARTASGDSRDEEEEEHKHGRDRAERSFGSQRAATSDSVGSLLDCPPHVHDDDTSQSSGPDTPASLSDAEPDVADVADVHNVDDDRVPAPAAVVDAVEVAAVPHTKTPPPPAPTTTAAADSRRSGGGGAVVLDACRASPLPVSVRVRHDHHRHGSPPATRSGCRVGRRGVVVAAAAAAPSSHHSGDEGRRPRGHGRQARFAVDKPSSSSSPLSLSSLSRPMRTRLRERREAAAVAELTSSAGAQRRR